MKPTLIAILIAVLSLGVVRSDDATRDAHSRHSREMAAAERVYNNAVRESLKRLDTQLADLEKRAMSAHRLDTANKIRAEREELRKKLADFIESPRPAISRFAGSWKVTYDNGVVRVYHIDRNGLIRCEDGKKRFTLQMRLVDGDVIATQSNVKEVTERYSLSGGDTLIVEHYHAKAGTSLAKGTMPSHFARGVRINTVAKN